MKTFLFTAGLLASLTASASSTDTLYVKQQQLPILIERTDNVLFDAHEWRKHPTPG